jgi:ATP-dependent DNA ligase
LFSRRGFDWSHRFPLIVEAAGSLRVRSISIDGEAVVCGNDGKPSFDVLRNRRHDASVFLYAFDLIELDGADLRREPLEQHHHCRVERAELVACQIARSRSKLHGFLRASIFLHSGDPSP